MMQLEDYFDFLTPDDIRVRGTRVGIETILLDYLELGATPEQIAATYPSLTLEQIYGTITYYLYNRAEIDRYLQAWKEHDEQMRRQHAIDSAALRMRLGQMKHSIQNRQQTATIEQVPA